LIFSSQKSLGRSGAG